MAVTVYKSSDTSAPSLSGTVGSLISVLDACLVNGYGSKSAAGWTKPFSGTNTAVYLGSAGHYLDVNDNGAGAAGAQEATVRGYETMTAVATGTNPFPTVAQQASPGLFIRKSAAASATVRGWVLIADDQTFYLFILSGDTAAVYKSFVFGRFYSFKSSDTYRSIILGRSATGTSATGLDNTTNFVSAPGGSAVTGFSLARTYAQTGTALNAGLMIPGSTSTPFAGPTNPADALVYLSRVLITEGSSAAGLRGYLRGFYYLMTGTQNDGDTFSGSGDYAGRTFVILKHGTGSFWAVETTAWDSSS